MASPIVLGTWPTPLEPARRLAAALGFDELWIKRDDLSGLGGGGNKVRKLEYTCAEALVAGATTLITTGAPQSNHARLTAAAAARLGLRSVLVLAGGPPDAERGNLILDGLAGAEIVWAGNTSVDQCAASTAAELRSWGDRPHIVPFGGSSSFSALGYVDCAREIERQLPDFDRIVVAVGSGGTMAGLVAALGPERVIGVDAGAVRDPHATVAELVNGMPGAMAQTEVRLAAQPAGAEARDYETQASHPDQAQFAARAQRAGQQPDMGAIPIQPHTAMRAEHPTQAQPAGPAPPDGGPEQEAQAPDGQPQPAEQAADAAPALRAEHLLIDLGQVGAGYGSLTERTREALKLAARTEGVFLDPTYTGRAMASLIAGTIPRHGRTVFLHTGGLPGLFGHPEL